MLRAWLTRVLEFSALVRTAFSIFSSKLGQRLTLINILGKRAWIEILTVRLVPECRVWFGMTLRLLPEVSGLIPRPDVDFGLKRHLGVGPTFNRNDLVWKFRLRR